MHSKLHSSEPTQSSAESQLREDSTETPSALLRPTMLKDLPLKARIPLAMMRLSSHGSALPIPHRQVIDVLSRILDPSPQRARRIASLNTWNEVVLARTYHELCVARSPAETLSNDEIVLIDALMRAQNHNLDKDDSSLLSIMDHGERIRFRDAGRDMMSGAAMSSTRRGSTWQRQPSVLECEHLCLAELIVLNMLRLWVRSKTLGFNSTIAVTLMSKHLGVPQLGNLTLKLLNRIGHSAYRKFDARCICCPEISPDEATLLDGLASIESDSHSSYTNCLLRWLPSVWAQAAFTETTYDALQLPKVGIALPQRDWDFRTLTERQPLFSNPGNGHRTVH